MIASILLPLCCVSQAHTEHEYLIRRRSYLQAIFAHASSLQSLVRQQDSDCADDQPDFAAASQLHKYLRVLAHLLQLDAAAVLAAAEAARSFLLGAYLRILSLRCSLALQPWLSCGLILQQ